MTKLNTEYCPSVIWQKHKKEGFYNRLITDHYYETIFWNCEYSNKNKVGSHQNTISYFPDIMPISVCAHPKGGGCWRSLVSGYGNVLSYNSQKTVFILCKIQNINLIPKKYFLLNLKMCCTVCATNGCLRKKIPKILFQGERLLIIWE